MLFWSLVVLLSYVTNPQIDCWREIHSSSTSSSNPPLYLFDCPPMYLTSLLRYRSAKLGGVGCHGLHNGGLSSGSAVGITKRFRHCPFRMDWWSANIEKVPKILMSLRCKRIVNITYIRLGNFFCSFQVRRNVNISGRKIKIKLTFGINDNKCR